MNASTHFPYGKQRTGISPTASPLSIHATISDLSLTEMDRMCDQQKLYAVESQLESIPNQKRREEFHQRISPEATKPE